MEMGFMDESCRGFVDRLASKAPTPGGGGASALCGAMGMGLGNMVISLTLGKKKYAAVEEELKVIQSEATRLQNDLLDLAEEDAKAFTPLARAYSMPSGTPEEVNAKKETLEAALETACQPPLDIMRACARAIELIAVIAEKGSVMAVSDAGAGANFCLCAMESASLNIYINTASMENRALAAELEGTAQALFDAGRPTAQAVISAVNEKLRDG